MDGETGKKNIYLDYQSAKPVDPQVLTQMDLFHIEHWGNPSSLHHVGDYATDFLDSARNTVSNFIHAKNPHEIIFTGSATESNNLAIIGYALRNKRKGNHIIISEVEHISVHNIAKFLEKNGFIISKVPVDQYGRINVNKLESRIQDNTILISVQMANNEIGTIQPIREIGEIANEKGITFHTDAVAAEDQLLIDVERLNLDMVTLSSNDLYGPKGVGALYVRKGVPIQPIIIGGGQENGKRSGSENMPGIAGMKKAIELVEKNRNADNWRMKTFQQKLIHDILSNIPDSYLNGHPNHRLPNNSHFRFDGIEGESILLMFKEQNIAVSTGSACSSKTLEPSHTLLATGLLHEEAHGSLEFTTGRFSQPEEILTAIELVPLIVGHLRYLSPTYQSKEEVIS